MSTDALIEQIQYSHDEAAKRHEAAKAAIVRALDELERATREARDSVRAGHPGAGAGNRLREAVARYDAACLASDECRQAQEAFQRLLWRAQRGAPKEAK